MARENPSPLGFLDRVLFVFEAIILYPPPPRFLERTVLRLGFVWDFWRGLTRFFSGLDVEIECARCLDGVGRFWILILALNVGF